MVKDGKCMNMNIEGCCFWVEDIYILYRVEGVVVVVCLC